MAALLWIPYLALFGRESFTSDMPKTLGDTVAWIHRPYLLLGLADLVLTVWAFVLFLNCLAEVHRFSAARAFVVGLLLFLTIVLLISGAGLLLGLLAS